MLRQKRPESNDPHDIADFVEARLDDMEQRLVGHMDAKFSEVRTWCARSDSLRYVR